MSWCDPSLRPSVTFSDTGFHFLFYLTYFSFFLLLLSTDTQSRFFSLPVILDSEFSHWESLYCLIFFHHIHFVLFIFWKLLYLSCPVHFCILSNCSILLCKGSYPPLPHPFLMQFSITGKVSGCSWPLSAGMPVTKLYISVLSSTLRGWWNMKTRLLLF